MNFKFNHHTIAILAMLEKRLHTSKTAIIEKALQLYAKKELLGQKLILRFAGILSDKEADSMLITIKSSRHNKDIETGL